MDPLSIALLSQLIPTAIDLGKAGVQGYKANQLSKTVRPTYQIPEEILGALNNAKYVGSMTELPGQNIMENKLGANLNRGVGELRNVSSTSADMAANVARLYSANNRSLNDIGIAAGQNWLNNQGNVRNALQMLAGYKDKAFDFNQVQPYLNNKAAEAALREGSFRNLSSAGTNLASSIGGAANMKYIQNLLNPEQEDGEGGSGTSQINLGNLTSENFRSTTQNPFNSNSLSLDLYNQVMGGAGNNNGVYPRNPTQSNLPIDISNINMDQLYQLVQAINNRPKQ